MKSEYYQNSRESFSFMQQYNSNLVKQIKDFKTYSYSWDEVIQKSNLDKQLEQNFNIINAHFSWL